MTATCPTCGQQLSDHREPLVVRKKPGRKKILGPRPWDLAGISRRTYYRREELKKIEDRRLKGKRRKNATP